MEDVPQEVIAHERGILETQARQEGKPEGIVGRIVQGRLEKFYTENCLLDQQFIRDQEKDARKVGDLVREMIAKFGENIQVRRFTRMELGG